MPDDVIHERFRAQAVQTPDATALVDGRRRVSYRMLDSTSDAIATRLVGLSVGPGQIVPVLIPSSALLFATLLAVLKRGAAYAVVDPSWPAEQLRHIAKVCGPITLTAPDVPTGVFERTWTPEADFAATAEAPPSVPVRGSDPAMVFFTSGTTGPPKAVLSPHQATVRLVRDCPFARFDSTTVMPQAAQAPWDAFALEVWGVLLTGGTCVLLEERPITPSALRSLRERHGVNTLFLTTSLFHLFVDEDIAAFRGARTVITGGEVLSPGHAGRFLAAHPDIRLVNGYGPVESTVFALYHDVRSEDVDGDVDGDVPIGRPVPGTTVIALAGDRPCVPGEVGEICVAGEGLALEYVGDPGLTAEKFVRLTVDGQRLRLYRTGDRGSVSETGVFRFAGRADRQVKVRGHRVEPGAVERVAATVPGVAHAMVVPVLGPTGNCEALVLFFRAAPDGPRAGELDAALRTRLPGYSVPDHVCRVAVFPLSATGKLDNEQLIGMARAEVGSARRRTVEGGSVLDTVAAEFESVLGGVRVDRDGSFLSLGGTSLGAIRVCTRLGMVYDRTVPVSQLARTPSVKAMAAWLEVPATDIGEHDEERVPLTLTQLSFLLAHLDSDNDVENHCLLAWRITGSVRREALAEAVEDVHQRHVYLRARYDLDAEDGATLSSAPSGLHVVEGGDDPDGALRRELGRPFDLPDGRVWRCVLVSTPDPTRWLLGVNVHHIAFDGWSEHLLAAELGAAYAARCQGMAPVFERPAPGHGGVRRLLAGVTAAADLPAQRRYWATALAGIPEFDLPTPTRPADVPSVVEAPLPLGDLHRIDRTAVERGTGRLAVLLTALGATLHELTGQDDFGVGVPISLRSTAQSERVVGCLINTVCVRLRPTAADPAAATALAVTEAMANSDLALPEVVRVVDARTRTGRRPLYQVLAAVQDSPRPELTLPGALAVPHGTGTAEPPAELAVELLVAGDPVLRVSAASARVAQELPGAVLSGVLRRLTAPG